MSKLNELRQERSEMIAAARAMLDSAETAKRSLTEDETVKYDELIGKQDDVRGAIEREERQVELDRETAKQVIESKPEAKGDEKNSAEEAAELETRAFQKAITSGAQSLNADEQRALKMGNDQEGGYLVPPVKWINNLLRKVDDMVFMRGLATVHQVADAQSLGVPSLENDPADAAWTSELAIGDEDSTMDFGSRSLVPHPLAKLIKVSDKLLRAASNADSLVSDRLAYKMAISQEKAFLTGDGANQPLGVFTASANGVSTSRDVSTGNTTTAIVADNLRTVKYTLKGQYHNNAKWLFHRDAVSMISKLKDGEGQYLWSAGITGSDPDRLVGLPVLMSEYAPNTFTTGLYVGMLADFSNYWIADALSMRLQRLNELYAAANQVGFISRSETDGMPVLEESFVRVTLG